MQGKVKKMVALVLCLMVIGMILAGCGASQTEKSASGDQSQTAAKAETGNKNDAGAKGQDTKPAFMGSPDETYYMVCFVTGVEYWVPVYEMFKQAGRQLGVKTVYTGTPEYDVNKELAVFEQVLAKKPTGVFLCPMNPDAFIEPINRAVKSGIPIVTFATDSPKSNRQVFITSDNVNEGNFAADAIAKELGGKGEVAVLENPGQLNHDIRVNTFIKRMETNWPDVKVVARAASNQDPNKAYQAVMTMVQAHPNIQAVFMPEANSGMGAAQASKELGGKIRILCCDVNAKILDMIKAGELWGAINPDQGMQGYFGMLSLFVAAHSDLVDPMTDYMQRKVNPVQLPYIDNGLTIVTKENADYYYLDKYLARRNSKGVEE